MRYLKGLLLAVVLLNFPVVGEGSINSDVRIEIISQIKNYEEEILFLSKKAEKSHSKKEKKLIIQQIKLLKEKIKKLRERLHRYENSSGLVG